MITLGIIGASHAHFSTLLRRLSGTGRVSFAGVAEAQPRWRRLACEQAGAPPFDTYEEMIEKTSPQAVYVATPNFQKAAIIAECLKRGLHVICTKPFALSEAECGELETVLTDSSAQLCADSFFRFGPATFQCRCLLEQGTIGGLAYMHAELPHRLRPEIRDEHFYIVEQHGGIVLDIGWNVIDFYTSLNDCGVAEAHGFMAGKRYPDKHGFLDTCVVALRMENGVLATFSADFIAPDPEKGMKRKVLLRGNKGAIDFLEETGRVLYVCTDSEERHEIPLPRPDEVPSFLDEFLDAVEEGRARRLVTHDHLLRTMRSVLLVNRAARIVE